MAKINPMSHIDSFNGKYHHTDEVYAKIRKFDEQVIGIRLKNPVTNDPPSEAQQAVQEKFKEVIAQAKTALENPEQKALFKSEWKKQKKYKTLLSFVFHKLYHQEEGGANG